MITKRRILQEMHETEFDLASFLLDDWHELVAIAFVTAGFA